MKFIELNFDSPGTGIESRPNMGKPYLDRIHAGLDYIQTQDNFEIQVDEEMRYFDILYKGHIVAAISEYFTEVEAWLMIKAIWKFAEAIEEQGEKK